MAKHKKIAVFLKSADKKRTLHIIYGVLAVFVLIFTVGSVYARYIYSDAGASPITAKDFYFSSNILSQACPTYELNAGGTGKATVTFQIRNYVDELRVSTHDISYEVTVTEGATLSATSGVLDGSTDAAPLKVFDEITVSNLEAGKTYTLSVRSVQSGGKGFTQTLSATLKVLPTDDSVYMHLDTSDPAFVVLTVWTKDVSGTAKITFPDGLIPDTTDPVILAANITNYNSLTDVYAGATFEDAVSFSGVYASHTYRFFIADTENTYVVSQFSVVVGGETAVSKNSID